MHQGEDGCRRYPRAIGKEAKLTSGFLRHGPSCRGPQPLIGMVPKSPLSSVIQNIAVTARSAYIRQLLAFPFLAAGDRTVLKMTSGYSFLNKYLKS